MVKQQTKRNQDLSAFANGSFSKRRQYHGLTPSMVFCLRGKRSKKGA
jgi:hypothetical protein